MTNFFPRLSVIFSIITAFLCNQVDATEKEETDPANVRPNIVFVLTDQWRASALGYAGDPNVKTPCLDQLAREGYRFSNAISVCPVCTPARAALMTGRYPTSTGMFFNDLHLPDQELCMGEIFKEANYDTAYIGKWHLNGNGRRAFVLPEHRQGFDFWKAAECDHNYVSSHFYEGDSSQIRHWEGYDAYAQTTAACDYLREHTKSEKPFFLFVSYGPPHAPHDTAPEEFRRSYSQANIEIPPNVLPEDQEVVRKELVGYYAHCSALDKCVGELIDTINKTGLNRNTIFLFTSDHGEMMGAHGVAPPTKQWPYDESVRVPLIIRLPEMQSPREIRTPIGTPDILPTLLALAGIAIPHTVEGDNLSEILHSSATASDRAALIMQVSPWSKNLDEYRGIRTEKYTYVRKMDGPWLMFDDQKDPWQMSNLIHDPDYTDVRADLERKLQEELGKIRDTFQPRQHYIDQWGLRLNSQGYIPFSDPNAEHQTPVLQIP